MSRSTSPTYKNRNWPTYNKALKRRGSLTIWFDPAMTWEKPRRPESATASPTTAAPQSIPA